VKAGGKPSNQLARNFGLYRRQEGNGRVDLSTKWHTMGETETAGLSHDHRVNQEETRTVVYNGPEKGRFCWSRKTTGKKCKGVLGKKPTSLPYTSVDFQWTTQCYIPEDSSLHNHHREYFKSYITEFLCIQISGCILTAIKSCLQDTDDKIKVNIDYECFLLDHLLIICTSSTSLVAKV
jgi:hypothetical protein